MLFDHPLRSLPQGAQRGAVTQVLEAALAAVRPDLAVEHAVRCTGGTLTVGGSSYALDNYERIRVLGVGKAARAMVRPLWEILRDPKTNLSRARVDGCLVIGKRGERGEIFGGDSVEFLDGAHPIPDSDSVVAAERAVEFVSPLGTHDLLILAISGGTSSLLTLPAEGLVLEEIAATTDLLLRAGVAIDELNTVRKHLSRVKGGQLAQAAAPATVVSLILSDVVGNSVSAIGSGPTAADDSTFQHARDILVKYRAESGVPARVLAHLDAGIRGERPETLAPDDPVLARVQNLVVASNESAAQAAVDAARGLGLHAELRDGALTGAAREVGERIANDVRQEVEKRDPHGGATCWVYGGETTVVVRGTGSGGRSQELALAAGLALQGVAGVTLVAFSTDGIDGPTDAAGAIVTGETLQAAEHLGLEARSLLDDNNTYHFFDALGDLLRTGPTGTNVADLVLVFMWPG